jgi:hypothetical protein
MNTTLLPEELNQIRSLSEQQAELIQASGQLVYQQFVLERQMAEIQQAMQSLEDSRDKLVASLKTKYGDCTIDLETGAITPA